MSQITVADLPGQDCGLCGYKTCAELADRLPKKPDLIKRCILLSDDRTKKPNEATTAPVRPPVTAAPVHTGCNACADAGVGAPATSKEINAYISNNTFLDSLGRPFDFFLEHFPEEPGPREIIIPHNPLLTREMDIQVGDVLIGRPLGMSCGCPITHCGVAMDVDKRTGVIAWCVTGPLRPRQGGFKDLGYYIAEAYEGLVTDASCEIKIGARYFFQPRMCMLQWRHSGLVNYLNHTNGQAQIRIEGLWIG